jgi:hypothetical protein
MPWQQLITLIGVVVGGGLTLIVTSRVEQVKWRRVLETRWDEKRFSAYADYALAVKKYVTLLRRVAADMGLASAAHPLPTSEGLPQIDDAESERAGAFESVLLLGDKATIDAARAWHRSAWELAYIVRGSKPGGPAEWETAIREVWTGRSRFYESARMSLGVQEQMPSAELSEG